MNVINWCPKVLVKAETVASEIQNTSRMHLRAYPTPYGHVQLHPKPSKSCSGTSTVGARVPSSRVACAPLLCFGVLWHVCGTFVFVGLVWSRSRLTHAIISHSQTVSFSLPLARSRVGTGHRARVQHGNRSTARIPRAHGRAACAHAQPFHPRC